MENTKQRAMISESEQGGKKKKEGECFQFSSILQIEQDITNRIAKDPQTCIISLNGLTNKPAVKPTFK